MRDFLGLVASHADGATFHYTWTSPSGGTVKVFHVTGATSGRGFKSLRWEADLPDGRLVTRTARGLLRALGTIP